MSVPQYLEFSLANCQTFLVDLSAGASPLQFGIVDTGGPNRPPFVIEYTGENQSASLQALSVTANQIALNFANPVDAVTLRIWLQGDVPASQEVWITADFTGVGAMVSCETPDSTAQLMAGGVALQIA